MDKLYSIDYQGFNIDTKKQETDVLYVKLVAPSIEAGIERAQALAEREVYVPTHIVQLAPEDTKVWTEAFEE